MANARCRAAACAALLLLGGTAVAEAAPSAPYVDDLLLRDGNHAGQARREESGRDVPEQDDYPGGEHVAIVALGSDRILMFGMGSYELDGVAPNNRVQMFDRAGAFKSPISES